MQRRVSNYMPLLTVAILISSSYLLYPEPYGNCSVIEPLPELYQNISLPPPEPVEMSVECALSRRMSVREFTEEPVSNESLSIILWAAYGIRDDGKRTVYSIEDTYGAHIYVFTKDAIYRYDPINHSLIFYKAGDNRSDILQYEAPIQLGLVWDTTISDDENLTTAEIGEIGQNIHFMASALNLGTVVTGERPSPLDFVGLPPEHVGKIVMPLGHPTTPYNFDYKPRLISLLPRIQNSNVNLTTAIEERNDTTTIGGELSRQQLSQVIWSTYGYSYLVDKSDQERNPLKRHRTVPSAHGYYPLRVYTVTQSGVYRYIPGIPDYDRWGLPIITFFMKIRMGDHRDTVADASESSVVDAPLIIIIVLDIPKTIQWDDLSSETIRWVWYYEAGASAYNVLLEATTWDLAGAIVPPSDASTINNLLRLNDDYQPLLIVPVGQDLS